MAIAADHAGVPLLSIVLEEVRRLGHEPLDLGIHDASAADDYPDRAAEIAAAPLKPDIAMPVLVGGFVFAADLIRALGGLANGYGSEEGVCGVLTGAACLLGLYAGKGTDDDHEDEMLKYLLNDLMVWFEKTVGGRHGGITCGMIVGDRTEVRQRCGAIVAETYAYVTELLAASGYDITQGKA